MQVRVLFFGILKDLAGRDSEKAAHLFLANVILRPKGRIAHFPASRGGRSLLPSAISAIILSSSIFEQPLHFLCRLSVEPRNYVAIRIERQCDRAVAEHPLDDLRMNTALE